MIGWIAAGLSIAGIFFNVKKNIWCWPIWLVSNVLWIYHAAVIIPETSSLVLWVVFLGSNIYGWYSWTKK